MLQSTAIIFGVRNSDWNEDGDLTQVVYDADVVGLDHYLIRSDNNIATHTGCVNLGTINAVSCGAGLSSYGQVS